MADQQSANNQAQQLYQANMAARLFVLQNALNMWQPIFTTTLANVAFGQTLNIPVRQVGLTKRFIVEVSFNVQQSAAETQTLTPFGPSNIFSNITLNDLANYTRINTAGWHLWMLSCMKRGFFSGLAGQGKTNFEPNPGVYGTAYTNDSPINAKAGWSVINAPATVTTAATGRMFFEVPCSYNDSDLRGAIYTNVVSATMYLQLTVNQNFGVGTGVDSTLAVYSSSTAALVKINSLTITVYQNYLDQIPQGKNGPVLPAQDISKMYLLTNTSFSGFTANQQQNIVFPNFRAWQSLGVIYDNNAVLNFGTDVAQIQLQTANLTNVRQIDPFLNALWTRNMMNNDFPQGMYYFDFRDKPVNTNQFGNMQLAITPSAVGSASSAFLVGFEGIGIANQVITAGSVPASA